MNDSHAADGRESRVGRLTREYVAAAARDPRRHPFGYLAIDPYTGSRGAFLWFDTMRDLGDALCTVEVGLLRLAADEEARIGRSVRRILGATSNPARIDLDALAAAFEGWSAIAWVGAFGDLCTRGGELPTSLRAAYRQHARHAAHPGPIADDELEAFVRFLGRLSGTAG